MSEYLCLPWTCWSMPPVLKDLTVNWFMTCCIQFEIFQLAWRWMTGPCRLGEMCSSVVSSVQWEFRDLVLHIGSIKIILVAKYRSLISCNDSKYWYRCDISLFTDKMIHCFFFANANIADWVWVNLIPTWSFVLHNNEHRKQVMRDLSCRFGIQKNVNANAKASRQRVLAKKILKYGATTLANVNVKKGSGESAVQATERYPSLILARVCVRRQRFARQEKWLTKKTANALLLQVNLRL